MEMHCDITKCEFVDENAELEIEIKRLKALVRDAFFEGYGIRGNFTVYTAWTSSLAKKGREVSQ